MPNELNITSQQLIEQMPGIILLKDLHSKFIFANSTTVKLFGYSAIDQIQDISDFDVRCDASQFAPQFVKEDQFVVQNKATASFVYIMKYADQNIYYMLGNKKLILDPHTSKPAGVLCQSTFISDPAMIGSIKHLVMLDKKNSNNNSSLLGTYQINNNASIDNKSLTTMQSVCLFYLLRGNTIKQIALTLNRSARTIETHVENLKIIFNCPNKSLLISKAIDSGFLYQIPSRVLGNHDLCKMN